MKKKDKGFTLVELVVTVALMAIAAGVLIPAQSAARENTNKKSDEAFIKEITLTINSGLENASVKKDIEKVLIKSNTNKFFIEYALNNSLQMKTMYLVDSKGTTISDTSEGEVAKNIKEVKGWMNNHVRSNVKEREMKSKLYKGKGGKYTIVYNEDNSSFTTTYEVLEQK